MFFRKIPFSILLSVIALSSDVSGYQRAPVAVSGRVEFIATEQAASFVAALEKPLMLSLKEVESNLGLELTETMKVYVLSGPGEEKEFGLDSHGVPDWYGAYAGYPGSVVVLRTSSLTDSAAGSSVFRMFRHEVSHILLAQNIKSRGVDIPKWFNEGIAMMEGGDWSMSSYFALSKFLITENYLPLSGLEESFPDEQSLVRLAYLESYLFTVFVMRESGQDSVRKILRAMKGGDDFNTAFESVTGLGYREMEKKWKKHLVFRYKWIPVLTSSFTLWSLITILVPVIFLMKKRREKTVMESWNEEEEQLPGSDWENR